MAEKRGNTIKLIYDFNDAWSCEVYLEHIDKWARITPREFRSYVGKRRILNVSVEPCRYEEYTGPLYYYGTNKICYDPHITQGTLYLNNIDPREKYRNLKKNY